MKVNYSRLILPCFSALIVAYLLPYLFLDVPSSDLGAHSKVVQRAFSSLSRGQLFFYDTNWFAGWPVFSFYGFLPHLLAAGLSWCLTSIVPESVAFVYTVRALSLAMCMLLPFSLYFCVSQFCRAAPKNGIVLPLICGSLSLLFLHNDAEFHGVGFGAIFHIGLFAQGFGWNLLFLHIGLIEKVRHSQGRRLFAQLSLTYALLILSHPLTAVFATIWSVAWLVFYHSARKAIIFSHLLSGCILAFWLVPFFVYAPQFSSGDKYPSVGSIDMLYGPVFYLLLVLFGLGLYDSWKNKKYERILFLTVIFIVDALLHYHPLLLWIPLGLHFYRFQGLIVLASLVPISVFLYRLIVPVRWGRPIAASFAIASLLILFMLPTKSSQRAIKSYQENETVELDEVLLALGSSGRVFFEFDSEYKITPYLSAHYFSSHFSGETLNGLFVESAPSNRFVSVTAETLGGGTYHNYFVFLRDAEISPWIALRQLQDMGVEYVVAVSPAFKEALLGEEKVFESSKGTYFIFRLPRPTPLLSSVEKAIVGYLDLDGGVPFSFVSYYFYSKESLYSTHELIELRLGEPWPTELDILLANGSERDLLALAPKAKQAELLFLPFLFKSIVPIEPFHLSVPVDAKVEQYRALESFFTNKYRLADRLDPDFSELPDYSSLDANIHVSDGSQALRFEGYLEGQVLRLNYNYHPYWKASGGQVFRGSAEKMIIFPTPNTEAVYLTYSYWNAPESIIATLVSAFSVIVLIGVYLIPFFRKGVN